MTLRAQGLASWGYDATMEAKEKIEDHDVACYSAFGSSAKIYQALPLSDQMPVEVIT